MGDAESREMGTLTQGVPVGVEAKQIKLVLVGPDCGGKTLLAGRLREHFGVDGSGNRRIPGDLESMRAVLNFALDVIPHQGFVLDQWQYPVDIIYRSVIEKELSPQAYLSQVLGPYLREHRVLFIHVTARDEVLRKRFEQRGDELWTIEQILAVASAYREVVPGYLYWATIDTSDLTPDGVFADALAGITTFYEEGQK